MNRDDQIKFVKDVEERGKARFEALLANKSNKNKLRSFRSLLNRRSDDERLYAR